MSTEIKSDGRAKTQSNIISMLQKAYRMEVETVANYLANSVYLDGVQAEEVKRSLASDVTEELGHARRLAERIKQLNGRVPGSLELQFEQESLRPPEDTTDVLTVVRGVVEAEHEAIAHYKAIFEATDGVDPVTQDLAVQLMADEEEHRTLFEGFLAELEK